jgi:hypothetical protein
MVAHVCNPSRQQAEAGDHKFEASLGYIASPFSKNQQLGIHSLVVEHLCKTDPEFNGTDIDTHTDTNGMLTFVC